VIVFLASVQFAGHNLTKWPLVTIGTPAYNSAWSLPKVLDSIAKLDYPKQRLRIVFVDNNSSDDSEEIIRRFVSSHMNEYESLVVRKCEPSVSLARNICLKFSEGTDYVFFIDADVVVPSEALQKLLAHFEGDGVGISSVPCDYENAAKRARFLYKAFVTPEGSVEAAKVGTGCTLISRQAIDVVGKFNEKLSVHEDSEYCFRTTQRGYKIICDHTFRAFHLREIKANSKYYFKFILQSSQTYIQMLRLRSLWHYLKFASSITLTLSVVLLLVSLIFFPRSTVFVLLLIVGSIAFAFWSNLNKNVLDDGSHVKKAYWPLVGAVLTPAVVLIIWISIARMIKSGPG
jgi:glycosyltransferase involved in cell wall biosynthesis